MSYEEMKAELAQLLFLKLKDRLSSDSEPVSWGFIYDTLGAFLRLAPDYYAAALRAGNTAEGKTVSEISERQAEKAE